MALAVPVYQDNGIVSIDTLRASAVVVDESLRLDSADSTSYISNDNGILIISSKQFPNLGDPQIQFTPTAVNAVGFVPTLESLEIPGYVVNIPQNTQDTFNLPPGLPNGLYAIKILAKDAGGTAIFYTTITALYSAPNLYASSAFPTLYEIDGGAGIGITNLSPTTITEIILSYYVIGKI
jgi:hypothetical protein